MNELIIAATETSPEIAIHVNPSYALYHWLRAKAETAGLNPAPEFGNAIPLMRKALNISGLHGFWGVWENSLIDTTSLGQMSENLIHAVASTGEALAAAIAAAETRYRAEIWPQQRQVFADALSVIEQRFASVFPAMAADHARLLDLTWPQHIDAYFVAETYERAGAYSHPLTISVTHNIDITLCETLLHETTHVAEDHSEQAGNPYLGTRIVGTLMTDGRSYPDAYAVSHAIIFASSAWRFGNTSIQVMQITRWDEIYTTYSRFRTRQIFGRPTLKMARLKNRS